jgi:hypothetical protein
MERESIITINPINVEEDEEREREVDLDEEEERICYIELLLFIFLCIFSISILVIVLINLYPKHIMIHPFLPQFTILKTPIEREKILLKMI